MSAQCHAQYPAVQPVTAGCVKLLKKGRLADMIYIVEDDSSIRELLEYSLNNSGFEARGFETPTMFHAAMREKKPELILLDIMLPEEDGLHILRGLRADSGTSDIPVIMLTAKTGEYDKVIGLDSGADDYVVKSSHIEEIIIRIWVLVRRNYLTPSSRITAGNLELDLNSKVLFINKQKIRLTRFEFEIMKLLVKNKGKALSKRKIMKHLYHDWMGK